METMLIIYTLAIVTVVTFPVVFVWYLNIGGVIAYLKDRNKKHKKT